MIPLSRWLSDRESVPQFVLPCELDHAEVTAPLPVSENNFDSPNPNREQELEKALHAAEESLTIERLSHVQREQRLRDEMATELVRLLTSQIEQGLSGMQRDLEMSIADILLPFAKQQSVTQAITALMGLVAVELRDAGQPLLEVRAPRELHDLMRPALENMTVSASLADGDRIELIFPTRTARFEQLASRWHEIIADGSA